MMKLHKAALIGAVLAASIFHYGEFTVREAKDFMERQGIAVRMDY